MWNRGADYIPSEKEMEQHRRDITEGRGSHRGALLSPVNIIIIALVLVAFVVIILVT